ncbi:hypothetical protein [Nonomuraea fuscirosea]
MTEPATPVARMTIAEGLVNVVRVRAAVLPGWTRARTFKRL